MKHQLRILFKGDLQQSWLIPLGLSTVGTGTDCSLRLENDDWQMVEEEHLEFRCTAEVCEVQDLATIYGTQIDGVAIEPHQFTLLKPNAEIVVGGYKLIYEQIPEMPVATEKAEEPTAVSLPQLPTTDDRETSPEPIPSTASSGGGSDGHDNSNSGLDGTDGDEPPPDYEPPFSGHHSDAEIHSRYLQYLPGIYHLPFVTRYLALLESVLAPAEWNIDNFDLFLDPCTTPAYFLPWLANWFGITFDESWSEAKRRRFLQCAHWLQPRMGTAVALAELLKIYTGVDPEIDDTSSDLAEATFRVRLPLAADTPLEQNIKQLIDAYKPAFTACDLQFTGEERG